MGNTNEEILGQIQEVLATVNRGKQTADEGFVRICEIITAVIAIRSVKSDKPTQAK